MDIILTAVRMNASSTCNSSQTMIMSNRRVKRTLNFSEIIYTNILHKHKG